MSKMGPSSADVFPDALLEELCSNAARLCSPGKGILASDESTPTIGKRLVAAGLENTEMNRRRFREVLYTAPGLGQYISGTIMFSEALYQNSAGGVPFVNVLQEQGILPGIKSDLGLVPIYGREGETSTQGLDGMASRCKAFYLQGARFAKFRCTIKISSLTPSDFAAKHNAEILARYAVISQASGLVPIVEPEILINGDHTAARAAVVTEQVLAAVFYELQKHGVALEAMLLKPMPVLAGSDCPSKISPEESARLTIQALQRTVPPAVPGIMFLSGGLSEEAATVHLNELNKLKAQLGAKVPWNLSFSFGRALQASVLDVWAGKDENQGAAQEAGREIARANSEATLGTYTGPHPSKLKKELVENFRGWRGEETAPPTRT